MDSHREASRSEIESWLIEKRSSNEDCVSKPMESELVEVALVIEAVE